MIQVIYIEVYFTRIKRKIIRIKETIDTIDTLHQAICIGSRITAKYFIYLDKDSIKLFYSGAVQPFYN
jgi:hypothetical protein